MSEENSQHDSTIFFIDRSLGSKIIAEAFNRRGIDFRIHDDYFDQAAPDTQWLNQVGKKGWVVLSKDKKIRLNPLEQAAILDANVAAFILTSGKLTGYQIADAFIKAYPKMLEYLASNRKPFIAAVTRDGKVRTLKLFR